MSEPPQHAKASKAWWLVVVLLGMALVVDLMDGEPFKLATTALLFTGSLLMVVVPRPMPASARLTIIGLLSAAVALIAYRLVVLGL